MAIYLLINQVFMLLQIDLPYKNNTSTLSLFLNFFLLHGLFPFCLNNVVPGAWYVGTLIWLFVLTPVIFVRIKKSKDMMVLSSILLLISVVLSIILNKFSIDTSNGSFFYFSFLNQSPAFLIGMSLSLSENETTDTLQKCLFRSSIVFIIIVALFYFEFSFSYAFIPFLSGIMFKDMYKILSAVPIFVIKKAEWVCYIGRNTFTIYLSHFLAAWYVPIMIKHYFKIDGLTLWIIALFSCMILCIFSQYISLLLSKFSRIANEVFHWK